ncbi:competence protein CoiA [Jeotgalibaca sp. A122]|uniref:competence protein CoiA n=1 Tax=Jeotgalibaca sp. A122 TaxID=3457322 RepID=UPI003FD5931B
MFFACTKNGTKINASDCPAGLPVTCPGCLAPVFLKKGNKIMAHFSHYAYSDCQQFSEGETERHLLGKQKLHGWLKTQNLDVEMEAWLPELKQRPDLLVTIGDRKIALEYQCSPIPFTRLKERTDGYTQNGYEVYWICGIDYIPQVTYTEKISAFRQPNGTVVCFDSVTNTVLMYYDLHFNTWNKLAWKCYAVNLSQLTMPALEILFNKPQPKRIYKSVPMSYRNQLAILQRKDTLHRDFLLEVYLNGQTLQTLPSFLFDMPTKNPAYRLPNYIWKYRFLEQLKNNLTLEDIDNFSKKLPRYDFLYPNSETEPLKDFIFELEQRGVLRRIDDKNWHIRSF